MHSYYRSTQEPPSRAISLNLTRTHKILPLKRIFTILVARDLALYILISIVRLSKSNYLLVSHHADIKQQS